MARLSASITQELKDQLYQQAEEKKLPVSHLVQAALDSYFGREPERAVGGEVDLAPLTRRLDQLTAAVNSLQEEVKSSPRRGNPPRYF